MSEKQTKTERTKTNRAGSPGDVMPGLNAQLQAFSDHVQQRVKSWVNEVTETADHSGFSRIKVASALKLVTWFVGRAIPFATRNGVKIIDFKPGYVKTFIPLKGNKNHFNAMYAGALFTVAELPGGIISVFSFDERFFSHSERSENRVSQNGKNRCYRGISTACQ